MNEDRFPINRGIHTTARCPDLSNRSATVFASFCLRIELKNRTLSGCDSLSCFTTNVIPSAPCSAHPEEYAIRGVAHATSLDCEGHRSHSGPSGPIDYLSGA